MTSTRTQRRARPDRDARRAERREQLLDAAIGAVRDRGRSVSMDALAAAGGVTKPIIYRHFGDRDGLVQAIAERFVADLLGELRAALMRSDDGQTLLVDTIDAYLRFVEREPNVYRFLQRQTPDVTGFAHQVAREVALVLGERLRVAGLDSGAAEPWAHGLVGMVHLAGDWWVDHKTMTRERLVTYLMQLSWDGLSSVPVADAKALEVAR
jgi:AcrR family transcriptional regulator